jgi:hypothetical protein
MTEKEKQLMEVQNEHLGELTSMGKRLIGEIASAAELLQLEFLGEIQLSADKKLELFKIISYNSNTYSEIVARSIKLRQKLINEIYDDKHGK